ncbi:MAG: tannase/feruloyl esterase family alpha/beta hydrolase [Burkholderiales bacterium]|nr:MAG: tannase/feruloyl esterase family alpha/beta hydrolase [Burkholderiales bacterium]
MQMGKRTGLAIAALMAASASAAHAQTNCASLKELRFPNVRIQEASTINEPVAHCKVTGVIGKELNFAVWLPEKWNGKFVMGGQGGFAGAVESQAIGMMNALAKGYATAGTDTGHSGTVAGGAWALGDMERIVNYAHTSIHSVSELGKATVSARYGRPADKSYFAGCSNGGRQALMAAQRYPDDFDGIIAGAPVVDFVGVAAADVLVTAKMYPDPTNLSAPVLNKIDREALGRAALAKCDKLDGLEDGIMTDPRKCQFEAKTLACKGPNKDGCLSPAELAAVEAIVIGPREGNKIYHPPFPWGGEAFDAGWGRWMAGTRDAVAPGVPSLFYGFGVGFMRYFVMQDPKWDYRTLNLATLGKTAELIQKTLSPNNPDLSTFRASGGKLLMYHGWSDSALTPLMSTAYVDKVYGADPASKSDVRLFMLPGVQHCSGGPGPFRIDYLDALDKWVSGAAAPDELEAGFEDGRGARKVCAYPKLPVYGGTGDGKSPSQFVCK